jgi:hypothetical protein
MLSEYSLWNMAIHGVIRLRVCKNIWKQEIQEIMLPFRALIRGKWNRCKDWIGFESKSCCWRRRSSISGL